jgi:hypothetical protein
MTRNAEQTYNGWTNYATWRVNLEIVDGYDPSDLFENSRAESPAELTRELADCLEEMAKEFVENSGGGVALDYAMAFLDGVNWDEIAEHYVEDYRDQWPEQVTQYATENA